MSSVNEMASKATNNQAPASTSTNNSQNELFDCSICMNTIEKAKEVITKCKHHFHKECFANWQKIKDNCPMCRQMHPLDAADEAMTVHDDHHKRVKLPVLNIRANFNHHNEQIENEHVQETAGVDTGRCGGLSLKTFFGILGAILLFIFFLICVLI
jgi:hypothetical protein